MANRCRVSRRQLLVAVGSATALSGCTDLFSGHSSDVAAGEGGYGREAYGAPTE